MKAKELIQFLETVVEKYGDISVSLNDGHGTFESINDVKVAYWTDNNNSCHRTVDIRHDGTYSKSESIIFE